MKNILTLLLVSALYAGGLAQSAAVVDSLERLLEFPAPDSVQVQRINRISVYYQKNDMQKATQLLQKSAALTERYTDRWRDTMSFFNHRAQTQLALGNMNLRKAFFSQAQQHYFEAVRLFELTHDDMGAGKAYLGLTNVSSYTNDPKNTLKYAEKAEALFEKLHYDLGLGGIKNIIANVLLQEGRVDEAIKKLENVGELSEQTGAWLAAAATWSTMMEILFESRDFDRALQYGLRALTVVDQLGDRVNRGLVIAKISFIYHEKGAFDKVRDNSLQILEIGRQLDNRLLLQTGYNNLAKGYLGEAKVTENRMLKDSFYVKAVECLELEKNINDSIFSAEKAQQMAEMEVKYESARKEKEISDLNALAQTRAFESLQREIELRQQKINADLARERNLVLQKTNENIALELEVKEARLQQQMAKTARDSSQIDVLQLKNDRQAMEVKRERQLSYSLLAGLLVLALFSFLLYRSNRQRALAQKKIEQQSEEIARQNQRLEAANRYKSVFLSNMSHEIRTPLNSIIGMSRLLDETALEDGQREYSGIIRNASENLLHIINEILDLSKIEAGKLELHLQPFDLHALADRQLKLLKSQAAAKKIDLHLELASDVPRHVFSDPARLNQILLNLLGNAVKFTEKGEVRLTVSAGIPDGKRQWVHFAVKDTGIGISKAQQALVFEPFVQVGDDTHMRHEGTGLGLAIVSQLVALMQGRISLDSEPGKGSVFAFSLPMEVRDNAASDSVNAAARKLPARLKILLVEDNRFNQLLATELLQKLIETPELTIAGNGQVAVEHCRQESFDLVLMDLKMPVLDGLAATRLIRTFDTRTPVIALTAGATAEERDKCLAAGMNDYITKPIQVDKLAEKISLWAG